MNKIRCKGLGLSLSGTLFTCTSNFDGSEHLLFMIAALINSVPLKLTIKCRSACLMYINPKFVGSMQDQDCNHCREKAISHLTDCRSLGINLHTALSFPSTAILIFTIHTRKKKFSPDILKEEQGNGIACLPPCVFCSWSSKLELKARDGRRSNFLH